MSRLDRHRPHPSTPDLFIEERQLLPAVPSLADVIAVIETAHHLMPIRRRDMISAVNRVASLIGRPVAELHAEPRTLADQLAKVSLASAEISADTLINVRSLLLAALKQAGVATMAGRSVLPLDVAWATLRTKLHDLRFLNGLSRFMSFCSARSIAPDAVDATTFVAFDVALETESLSRKPAALSRRTRKLWNQAVDTIPGWPATRVIIPARPRQYSLPWADFPQSFQNDAQAYLNRIETQDILADDYAPPTRPSTVALRRRQLRQLASALVLAGFPIAELTGLDILVEQKNARTALNFLLDRTGRKATVGSSQQARLLLTIARYWVKVDTAKAAMLRQLTGRVTVQRGGMTSKNRDRLRQFDNPATVRALLDLPRKVFRKAGHTEDPADARAVQCALAVELLITAPLRIDNLAGLEVDRHLVRPPARGKTRPVHIVIPAREMKNKAPFEVELPPDTAAMLEDYLAHHHSRLSAHRSAFLFPNQSGDRRNTTSFATKISQFIRCETGIVMNVHIFRHMAVKLHLDAHPNDLETVRRMLGHSSLATTTRNYTELNTAAAFRRHDAVISGLRTPTPTSSPARLRKPRS